MPYDIYGNNLRNGFCEVHPYVEQEYPCQICWQEIEREEQRQRENREHSQLQNEQYHLQTTLQQQHIEKLEVDKAELLEALEIFIEQNTSTFTSHNYEFPEHVMKAKSLIQKHKQ